MSITIEPCENFYRAFKEVQLTMNEIIRTVLTDAQISVSEYELLRIVENSPEVTAAEATMRMRITGPSVSALIASLEKKDLITRMQSADDARVRHISLTTKGLHIVRKARDRFTSMLQDRGMNATVLREITQKLSPLLPPLP